jgi:hypothetical protein
VFLRNTCCDDIRSVHEDRNKKCHSVTRHAREVSQHVSSNKKKSINAHSAQDSPTPGTLRKKIWNWHFRGKFRRKFCDPIKLDSMHFLVSLSHFLAVSRERSEDGDSEFSQFLGVSRKYEKVREAVRNWNNTLFGDRVSFLHFHYPKNQKKSDLTCNPQASAVCAVLRIGDS